MWCDWWPVGESAMDFSSFYRIEEKTAWFSKYYHKSDNNKK